METTKVRIEEVTPDMIASVYSGRPGCACGCRGTHTSGNESADKRMLTRFKKIASDVEGFGNGFSIETPTRLNCIYLKDGYESKES